MSKPQTPPTIASLNDWLGRQKAITTSSTLFPANALAAALDYDQRFAEGDALPALGISCISPCVKQSELGSDDHAHRGSFAFSLASRRMWAGGDLRWHRPLQPGARCAGFRAFKVLAKGKKQGKSGELVFVRSCMKFQTLPGWRCKRFTILSIEVIPRLVVLLRVPVIPSRLSPLNLVAASCRTGILLLEYSALSFNGHRIRYDRRATP